MTIDMRGKLCPLPVIEAKKRLEGLKKDDVLEVIVDNSIAVENLEKLARIKNQDFKFEKINDKEFHVFIKVVNEIIGEQAECQIMDIKEDNGNTVVIVDNDSMGKGSYILGRKLIKGFFNSILQLDNLPKAVYFYNQGAFLTGEGSIVLDELRELAEAGVDIYTCGTCVDFYGIREGLQIGELTNMYEIVRAKAEYKVISI